MPDGPGLSAPCRLLYSLEFIPALRAARRFAREREWKVPLPERAVPRPLHGGQQDCDADEDDSQQRDHIGEPEAVPRQTRGDQHGQGEHHQEDGHGHREAGDYHDRRARCDHGHAVPDHPLPRTGQPPAEAHRGSQEDQAIGKMRPGDDRITMHGNAPIGYVLVPNHQMIGLGIPITPSIGRPADGAPIKARVSASARPSRPDLPPPPR